MYYLIANRNIKDWLKRNLAKYNSYSSNKYIIDYYSGVVENKGFKISVYSTNLITIDGHIEFKNRIYKALILNSEEIDTQGMDEVGVGDFFGPVVYVSIFLDQKSVEFLANTPVKINDSKKLTDIEVLDTYNKLKNNITYNHQIIFDSMIKNLNSIEQKMVYHNKNIFNSSNTVLDLFTTVNSFNKYSKSLNLSWPKNIILETKADSKYISVALASIFARAIFLQQIDLLEDKYNYSFPLGANNVIDAGVGFCKKYSHQELATFSKTSFKTFNQIKDKIKT